MMWFGVITLFPDMFAAIRQYGITSRAIDQGMAQIESVNPRQFTQDVHRTVDGRPFGGGPGMVMLAEPLAQSIECAKHLAAQKGFKNVPVVYLSPQGQAWTELQIQSWLQQGLDERQVAGSTVDLAMILLCGRYEGIDERLIERYVDLEYSIGDYVLSGGELAAMVIMDSLIRRLPDALHTQASAEQDSFAEGLLDCPHYSKPVVFEGLEVPEVLRSGHHVNIAKWRFLQQVERTKARRPDLLLQKTWTAEQLKWLKELSL